MPTRDAAHPLAAPGADPAISVVLVTSGGIAPIRETLACVRLQTVRDRIEAVIVSPTLRGLDADDAELSGFARVELVESGPLVSTGAAIAAGFRAAHAPIVAYAEEHAFPEPEWAETLIAAHEGPWAAVGYGMANANPDTVTSWAHAFTDFAPWLAGSPAREVTVLAPHLTSYKRTALIPYGEQLDQLLEVESVLHRELRRGGHRLLFEPAARMGHLQTSRFRSYVRVEFEGGRTYGAERAASEGWPVRRRLLYVLSSPLIPLVRLWRLLPYLRAHPRSRPSIVALLPPMLVGVVAHTMGECAAYAFGAGDARGRRLAFELDRRRHVRAAERTARPSGPAGPSRDV